jgi:chromate reductase
MTSPQPLRIMGLTNSLRSASFNRMTMDTVGRLMQPAMRLQVHDLNGILFYDPETEDALVPLPVQALERALIHADGLVIVSPEYNHSIPGRLKNAIDCVSRLPSQPLECMPVMILSAATSPLGGARMQYELRRVLDSVGAATMIKPEVFIGLAEKKFDAGGECTDGPTIMFMQAQIDAFQTWIAAVNSRAGRVLHGHGLQQA